ncbi:helix-turn-helix domain-containing protein [Bacillus sp. ISL-75]|nr:helix-turn-helix domain-containing protein [Bacillus sp. ISL-75]
MIKYREILRLNDQGLSNRSIASSCGCSRNTVNNVIKRADELQVSWPLEKDITDTDLQNVLYPEKGKSDLRKQPDCCEILVCIVNQY